MSTPAILLSVVGGTLELGGVGFVVREIKGDRDLARRYLQQIEEAPPPRFHAPYVRPEVEMMRNHPGAQGTPEQQITRLRGQQAADVRRVSEAATNAVSEERRRFASFVGDLLQGGLGERRLGAILVALGIVVNMAAGIVSSTGH